MVQMEVYSFWRRAHLYCSRASSKALCTCAAAIGGGLADLLTAPMWAPATIIIKMLITLPFTSQNTKILNTRNIIAPFLALAISATGYYLAEGILFGSFLSPLASISGSVIQSGGKRGSFLPPCRSTGKNTFKKPNTHFN